LGHKKRRTNKEAPEEVKTGPIGPQKREHEAKGRAEQRFGKNGPVDGDFQTIDWATMLYSGP